MNEEIIEEEAPAEEAVEEAKRMGWVEQEKFKGDPDRWVEAEKFVERGKNELPIMRERQKKADSNIKNLNNKISKMSDTFKEFRNYAEKREQSAVDKAVKDITAKQRVAVEDGDTPAFDKLEEEKTSLLQEELTVPEINDDIMEEELQAWVGDGNEWFYDDKELGDYAAHMSPHIAKKTNATGAAFFDEVKKEVMLRFPDKFKKPQKAAPPELESGTEQAPPAKGKQTYANLPADAKAACDDFVNGIPGFTKEEYLKSYEW
jgi:hypothetical protein